MIKVMLVDNQQLFAEGIKSLLECDPDITITMLALNGKEAFEQCHNDLPDVILMDILMPVCTGIEATELIKSKFPSIKIIILTSISDDAYILNALEKGADGYMLKETNQYELIHTIKGIHMGMGIIHHNAYHKLVDKIISFHDTLFVECQKSNHDFNLPKHELDIIKFIVDGFGNREIASKMSLSEGTVRNRVSKLLGQFQLKDRIQLAVFALKNGIH